MPSVAIIAGARPWEVATPISMATDGPGEEAPTSRMA